jgi:hypothetical protein
MYPIWLILGSLVVLLGLFNKKLLQRLNIKPMSEVFTDSTLRKSSRKIEEVGRWLVITLGAGFLVQGLGTALPNEVRSPIVLVLLGLSALLLAAMFTIAVINWRTR